jgi:hypothetical protein
LGPSTRRTRPCRALLTIAGHARFNLVTDRVEPALDSTRARHWLAVDEECWCLIHAASNAVQVVSTNPGHVNPAGQFGIESVNRQPDSQREERYVRWVQHPPMAEQQIVHLPEFSLCPGSFGGLGVRGVR